jgi:hypothetical protein
MLEGPPRPPHLQNAREVQAMKNSVLILAHLKAHKCKDPTYERTMKGMMGSLGLTGGVMSNTLSRLKKAGLIEPNPSKMIVGKCPNGSLRGRLRPNVYNITPKGIEWLEVRQ